MRLYNYIKNSGYLRNELEELYKNNLILVNGNIKPLTYDLEDNDIVTINNCIVPKVQFVYYLYNKPKGIISTNLDIENSFVNNIDVKEKVFCSGRLDKESSGLMLLTNDGKYSNYIHQNNIEKEYIVEVKNKIDQVFINDMINLKELDGIILKPIKMTKISDFSFKIILTEGKYHQIRKMVKMCKNTVVELKRIRIGIYKLDNLLEGQIKRIKQVYKL